MKKAIIFFMIIMINFTVCFADYKDYDSNGHLALYQNTEYNAKNYFDIPVISKKTALQNAVNFILENSPEITNEIDISNEYSVSYNKTPPYGYNIVFHRVINKIPYTNDYVNIIVDGHSGEIIMYSKFFDENIVTPENIQMITAEHAMKQFISSNGLELRYNKKISDGKIITYLTYSPNESIIINAETGNIIFNETKLPTDGYFDITLMSEKATTFINGDESVISLPAADNIARSIKELEISDKYIPTLANYIKNYDGTYFINITYQNDNDYKSITLNAVNGDIAEYSDNSSHYSLGIVSDCNEFIDEFVKENYQQYLSDTVKTHSSDNNYTVNLYERRVEGIPYKSNGIYVCTDNSGKIKNISFAWDNVSFDKPNDIFLPNNAYNEFFKKCGLKLSFYKRENGNITPVYIKSPDATGIIDAKSLRQLNYDGSRYYAAKDLNYIDINSHYSKDIAISLANCEIYASSGNVYLGDYISQKDYLYLLTELIQDTKPVLSSTGILNEDQLDMLYSYMLTNGILDAGEIDYDGYVTRADAVKYLLKILGYGTVADMTEIFKSHFADAHIIPSNMLGYIELARSLNLVIGSDNNFFYPNDYITNGDSLIIMYNYLSNKK